MGATGGCSLLPQQNLELHSLFATTSLSDRRPMGDDLTPCPDLETPSSKASSGYISSPPQHATANKTGVIDRRNSPSPPPLYTRSRHNSSTVGVHDSKVSISPLGVPFGSHALSITTHVRRHSTRQAPGTSTRDVSLSRRFGYVPTSLPEPQSLARSRSRQSEHAWRGGHLLGAGARLLRGKRVFERRGQTEAVFIGQDGPRGGNDMPSPGNQQDSQASHGACPLNPGDARARTQALPPATTTKRRRVPESRNEASQ